MTATRFAGACNVGGGSEAALVRAMLRGKGAEVRVVDTATQRLAVGAREIAWGAGRSPVTLEKQGYIIVATATLYNRDEVQARLSVEPTASDISCILDAYLLAGERCLDWLIGDFAFAIWDPAREILFCARDHFGIEPFYYESNDMRFVFAGELGQFDEHSKSEIAEAVIGDFVLGRVADTSSTLYRNIKRLPPAHYAVFGRGRLDVRRYWSLGDAEVVVDRNPADQFRSLFETSVRTRLDAGGTAGILLSGGLDSSSIACTARRARVESGGMSIPTFSLIYEARPNVSERRFMEAVLDQGGFTPTVIPGDDAPPFGEFERLLAEQEGPFLAPSLAGMRAVFAAAQAAGTSVLLDGHGGDEVASHGFGRIEDLARAGRWLKLWRELAAATGAFGDSKMALWLDLIGRHAERYSVRRVANRIERLGRAGRSGASGIGQLVNPDFSRRIALRDRAQHYADGAAAVGAGERERHRATLESPSQPYAFEVLHRLNRATGMQSRYPFWDKRLVEFCVAVPAEAKLDGGWSRLILRQAMAGILPREVQWRRSKFNFSHHTVSGMFAHHRGFMDQIVANPAHPLFDIIDRSAMTELYDRVAAAPHSVDGRSVQALWRVVSLGLWLQQRSAAGAVPDAPSARVA